MLTLRTLGSVDLRDSDGREVTAVLAQPKRMALLVYLALGRPRGFHRRDTLLGLFWPDRDEARARSALSQSLSFLRRHLPEEVVATRGAEELGVVEGSLHRDVEEFEAALADGRGADALAVYDGDLLRGFHLSDAPAFQEWVERERDHLRRAASAAAWSLAGEQIDQENLAEAEVTAGEALTLAWPDEPSVRAFIARLADAGARTAALRFYRRFVQQLRDDFDLAPSPETVRAVEEIRSRRAGGARTTAPERQRPADRNQVPTVSLRSHTISPPPPGPAVSRRRSSTAAIAAAVTAVLVVVGWLIRGPERWEPDPRVVAVAPFENRSSDPTLDEYGALVAVSIQTYLDRQGISEVVSQPLVEQVLADGNPDANAVDVLARDLAVGIVVTGELYLVGDSILIRAHCLDSATRDELYPVEAVVTSKAVDRKDVDEVRDRVSAVLAQHLDRPYATPASVTPPPVNMAAYREYRRSWDVLRRGASFELQHEAIPHLRRAWELDTTFVQPLVGAWVLYGNLGPEYQRQYDSLSVAVEAARARMTPFQARYVDMLRFSREGEAELAYQAALALSEAGRLEAVESLGLAALATSRPRKAAEVYGRLEKGSGEFVEGYVTSWEGYWAYYASALHLLGRYGKELDIAREHRKRYPARRFAAERDEARALAARGRMEALTPIVERWRREEGFDGRVAVIFVADELAVHGFRSAARTLLEDELTRVEAEDPYARQLEQKAMILHRLGRNEEALRAWSEWADPTPPGARRLAMIGLSSALTGDPEVARDTDRQLAAVPESQNVWTPLYRAQIAAALGEPDRAVDLLRGFIPAWQGPEFQLLMHREFTVQSLLGAHPAFQDLMKPVD